MIAGVEFFRVETPLLPGGNAKKLPPKKCRNCPYEVLVGVGTSGSIIAITKLVSGLTFWKGVNAKVTGIALSVRMKRKEYEQKICMRRA